MNERSNNKFLNTDIDNKIMNVACLLQYQRDFFEDKSAGRTVSYIIEKLFNKINKNTGMWGTLDKNNRNLSRIVQFAYHMYIISFYDKIKPPYINKLVNHILLNQNQNGGFGEVYPTSACEDIDSIDILIRCSPYITDKYQNEKKIMINSN